MNYTELTVTPQELNRFLKGAFASREPLKLEVFPTKQKRQYWVLDRLAEEFEYDRSYTQDEVTNCLWEIYADPLTLRRYLIAFGFMDRKSDGSAYWRVKPDRPEHFETIKQEAAASGK